MIPQGWSFGLFRKENNMPRVRVKNGPAKNSCYDVVDKPLSLGREPTCDIQIMDKGSSRNHAELFRIGEMCFIRDLESRNGTFVNEVKIDEELLREGDRIQIGATILVFETGDAPAENDGLEFSEEAVGNTLELRLEDLSAMNVGEGDGGEAKRLRGIYRLGRILAEEKDEAGLIEKVLPFVAGELNADCAYLFTRDAVKGNIVPIGTFSRSGKKGGKISRSIIRRAIQEKRALLTSDAMQDDRFSARDSIMLKQIHSVICVPLAVTGDLSGVLYLAGNSPSDVFNEEDLELSAAMADQIGLAISHLRVQETQRENLMSTIRVLVRAAEMKQPSARGRSERIANYALAIGRRMRMTPLQLESLQLAALLHNIGLLAEDDETVAEKYREKDGREFSQAERQVRFSLDIVRDMACFSAIEDGVRYQLEFNDGSGPEGMKGENIPLSARIVAVASEFDRLITTPTGISEVEALKQAVIELGRQSGRKFDEDVVKALLVAHRNDELVACPEAFAEEE
jgi:response regulator RpfG family c-di-GMP phosphodiesterase/pSer/pThr/pTyr-binding forkhead associated (FHA) protein